MPDLFEKFGCLPDGTPGENLFLSREERNCFMSLLEIFDLGMRSSISNVQLDHLDGPINKFVRDLTIRHPEVIANTNLHTLTHFARDVRQFGPCYGWWSFTLERINLILKQMNQSGSNKYQASVVAFGEYQDCRNLVRVGMMCMEQGENTGSIDRPITLPSSPSSEALSTAKRKTPYRKLS